MSQIQSGTRAKFEIVFKFWSLTKTSRATYKGKTSWYTGTDCFTCELPGGALLSLDYGLLRGGQLTWNCRASQTVSSFMMDHHIVANWFTPCLSVIMQQLLPRFLIWEELINVQQLRLLATRYLHNFIPRGSLALWF